MMGVFSLKCDFCKFPFSKNIYNPRMIQVYIKPFCPYCIRLLELLDQKNISYEKTDIIADSGMAQVMREKSGQTGVPEVEIANVIIPDYVTEETLVEDIQKILAV